MEMITALFIMAVVDSAALKMPVIQMFDMPVVTTVYGTYGDRIQGILNQFKIG